MLRWMDGFDHYGSDAALLTQGVYAQATGVTLSNANPRTGTRCARINPLTGDRGLRRVFGADLQEVGIGYAFNIPTLPTDSETLILAAFADNAYEVQCSLVMSSTGQILLYRSYPTANVPGPLLATSAPCVSAGAYNHFEVRMFCDDYGGACEVRLNGVTVLNVTGVDNAAIPGAIMAQVKIGMLNNVYQDFPAYMDVDDLFCWDATGALNNDFVGDKKVYTRFPDADTATEEWTPSTGVNSFAMLDNVPPLDGTEYLEAQTAPAQTIVGLADLPAEVVSIAGLMTATRLFKTDAGNAKVEVGIINGSDSTIAPEHPATMAATYYHDIFEADPATGLPWTVSGFATARLSLDRTE